jgi:WD40 repeat protein
MLLFKIGKDKNILKILKVMARIHKHPIYTLESSKHSLNLPLNFNLLFERSVVRKFPGHEAEVTDLTFSADSRWLLTSSLDSTCRLEVA